MIIRKKNLAKILGISARTLQYWLNEKYFEELKKLDYNKNQQIITPKQYFFLKEKISITPEEEKSLIYDIIR